MIDPDFIVKTGSHNFPDRFSPLTSISSDFSVFSSITTISATDPIDKVPI